MLDHPRVHAHPAGDLDLEADVVVVGTGAGGAVFASELAEAGLKVIMLEKGGHWDRRDFDQKEATMMPRLYEDAGARTTADGGISVLHASCVGGTTVINNAICFHPPAFVLQDWADRHGVRGVSLETLDPSLRKVEFVLNVQPISDGELNENARLMRQGVEKLGLKGAAFRHNRTGCAQSGFCMVGCSYDRKQTMLVTYVPRALHFGAELYPFAKAERVVAQGRRVTAIEGSIVDHGTGKSYRFRVRAKVYAIAGGAISTPLLLLQSDVANSSGRVGTNLRLHPIVPAFATFDHEVKAYKGIPQGYYVDQFLQRSDGSGGYLLESIFTHPAIVGATVPEAGAELRQMMTRLNHLASAYVQVLDHGSGRVTVGAHGRPAIAYAVDAADQAKIRDGLKHLVRILLAAGAREVAVPHVDLPRFSRPDDVDAGIDRLDFAVGKLSTFSAHQMGTCPMGEDPSQSVVNSQLRAHDLDNLFVTDSSVFPTAIGVNPQITIASLATHAARGVVSERARYF
jgi:choline dehydrogenase-like flavoprotein